MRNSEKYLLAGVASLLLLPLLAMQFSDEVVWSIGDFVVAALLLGGAALAYILAARRLPQHRIACGLGIALALALVWAELAVGIFGTPFAGS